VYVYVNVYVYVYAAVVLAVLLSKTHRVFLLERIERVWPKETQVVFCISAPHGAAAQTHAQMARMACM
jgi:hypothetical protein